MDIYEIIEKIKKRYYTYADFEEISTKEFDIRINTLDDLLEELSNGESCEDN